MTTITQVLTDVDQGLLPWLDANLEGEYGRLQIRPWNFGSSADQRSGFRLRDFKSDNTSNQPRMTRTVLLGRIFPMTGNINATLAAGTLIEHGCILLHQAADCRSHIFEIDHITGSSYAKQDKTTGWYMICVFQFDITYQYD